MGFGTIKWPKQFFIRWEEELEKAVKQFFFLHYPTSRKVDNRFVTRTNAEDRKELIETLGEECFVESKDFDYLRDPNIPLCFSFVFSSFIEIYNHSHEVLTWTDIYSYAIMRKIDFTQTEIDYIIKCNAWANEQIKKMRDEEDGSFISKENDEAQTSVD